MIGGRRRKAPEALNRIAAGAEAAMWMIMDYIRRRNWISARNGKEMRKVVITTMRLEIRISSRGMIKKELITTEIRESRERPRRRIRRPSLSGKEGKTRSRGRLLIRTQAVPRGE
jgi:hypothetical protein